MKVVISPTYSDIFGGDVPSLNDLLKDIPSEVVITILSLINSQLYLGHGLETQMKIFEFLSFRQSSQTKSKILSRLKKNSEKDPSIEFFGLLCSTEFIHYELINYRDFQIIDTTPDQELNLIKAYFLMAEIVNEKYHAAYKANEILEAEYFQKMTWPTLIDQFEVNHNINPFTGVVKGLTLLNFLEHHSPYKEYVDSFLLKNEKKTTWNYVLDLFNLLKSSWDSQKQNPNKLFPPTFKESDGFKSLFQNFTISIESYLQDYCHDKRNFSGLKDKPLFQLRTKNYLVLNWNYLSNKLYDGLLFDFFNQSGISERIEFKSIRDFKSFISNHVIEKFLFKKLLEKCIMKKHVSLKFDEGTQEGFPDCYVREGKNIFLVEIKDAFFPASSVNSLSYNAIKETIDKKYNGEKKGTGQIIKQLERLRDSTYEQKTFEELKLKRKNLRIYPIMIYTDNFFNLPGINQYLKIELSNKIKLKKLDSVFGKIEDLTFINLSFLIEKIHFISTRNFTLKRLINDYHDRIKVSEKKLAAQGTIENLFSVNDPFESVISTKYSKEINSAKDYVETIVKTLNLTENLG